MVEDKYRLAVSGNGRIFLKKMDWKEQIKSQLDNYYDKCAEVEEVIADLSDELGEYMDEEYYVDWDNVDDAIDVWVMNINDMECVIILEEVLEKVKTGMSIEDAVKYLLVESFTKD